MRRSCARAAGASRTSSARKRSMDLGRAGGRASMRGSAPSAGLVAAELADAGAGLWGEERAGEAGEEGGVGRDGRSGVVEVPLADFGGCEEGAVGQVAVREALRQRLQLGEGFLWAGEGAEDARAQELGLVGEGVLGRGGQQAVDGA